MPTLYLIPTTLGECDLARVFPPRNAEVAARLRHFIVENVRSARRFLKRLCPDIVIDELTFYELNEHTRPADVEGMLRPMDEGCDMGVLSEAGCPAVADPGADVVAVAQRRGYTVEPMVGPSSLLLALMASGFNGQSFAFAGYLPVPPAERAKALRRLEARAYAEGQTQLFIETPYRNMRMLDDILRTCQPDTRLCVAADLTLPTEYVRTLTVREWRRHLPDLGKRPCIFLIYK